MAATENTTRTEAGEPAATVAPRQAGSVAVAALAGALLIGLAVPRAGGHLEALSGSPTAAAIREGRAVAPERLEGLIASREAALAWLDEGRYWHELGLGWLVRSQELALSDAEGRSAALAAARDALVQAVSRRPLDSHAWLRLCLTELLSGDRPAAAAALAASMQAAPVQRDQFPARLRLGGMLWDLLGEEGQDLWRQQARLLWAWKPEQAVALAVQSGQAARFRAALEGSPGAAEAFADPPRQ